MESIKSLFTFSPNYYRKDYKWPITPLPLWTKPTISKEMIEHYLKQQLNNPTGKE